MNEILMPNARLYASQQGLEIVESLGSGKDGIVTAAENKAQPGTVAIKALRWEEAYLREKHTYERLKDLRITTVMGFNVPALIGFQDDLRIIEMTIVKRPFVLDFAGACLDQRPPFPQAVWDDWEVEKREQFEKRWPEVRKILDEFENLGIYLMDVSPSNISFKG